MSTSALTTRYKNHHYSTNNQIREFLNPSNGHRGALEKKGIKPRDHVRENRQALKDVQEMNRQRKIQEGQKPPEPWKMQRFLNVQSKIATDIAKSVVNPPASAADHRPASHFLRKGTLNKRVEEKAAEARQSARSSITPGSPPQDGRRSSLGSPPPSTASTTPISPRTNLPRKPSVPKATDLAKLAPKSDKNHIIENRRSARHLQPPRSEVEDKPRHHKEFGVVPEYLQQRKQEWADEEERRRQALPDPNCPPGMRLMSEDERLETLASLDANESEIRRQLVRMPLQIDTPSMMRRREDLERRLGEISRARLLFSKEKVFVKADEEVPEC